MKTLTTILLAFVVIAVAIGLFYLLRNDIIQNSNTPTTTDLDITNKNIPIIPPGWQTYPNNQYGFSVSYPSQFQLQIPSSDASSDWEYLAGTATGTEIANIYIPKSFEGDKTNFGDAGLKIGVSQNQQALSDCLNPTPINNITNISQETINGINFTKYSQTDAGAGNRYQITSYRTIKNNTCFAIDLMVHYSVLENYDPSMGIKAFDQNRVNSILDQMLKTFYFNV